MNEIVAPTLLAAFAAGALSFLSPCVLPLVPGYLSMVSGGEAQSDRGRVVFNALLFVIGFTTVFIAYGAAASALGSVVNEHRVLLSRVAGALIIVMGLSLAGLFRPMALMRTRRFTPDAAALGPYAAPVMGAAFAFGWTPCVGPVLAAVLTLAAAEETLSEGVGLLAAYSAGLGIPFLLAGLTLGRFRSTWDWFKRRGRVIDAISGTVLVAFGVLLMTNQIGRLSGAVIWFFERLGITSTLG